MWCPTSFLQLAEVERRLFAHIPDLLVRDVPVGAAGAERIHTIELRAPPHDVVMAAVPAAKRPAPLVCLHGYGFGVGMWAHNLVPLSRRFGRVLCLDWLGCGSSSRPTFRSRGVDAAEAFFVDSLEEWRDDCALP